MQVAVEEWREYGHAHSLGLKTFPRQPASYWYLKLLQAGTTTGLLYVCDGTSNKIRVEPNIIIKNDEHLLGAQGYSFTTKIQPHSWLEFITYGMRLRKSIQALK
jgi:hypothetical protein